MLLRFHAECVRPGDRIRWLAGYFFDPEDSTRLYTDEEARQWLLAHPSADPTKLNGEFSFVSVPATNADESPVIELFTSRYGLIPLFFTLRGGEAIVGDNAVEVGRAIGTGLNAPAALTLIAMEFVPGTETLLEGVEQAKPGEIVRLELRADRAKVTRSPYWQPRVSVEPAAEPIEDAAARLGQCLLSMGDRWAGALSRRDGRISIPLSGGLDSRLLATILSIHLHGRAEALCYGDPGSQDVALSRRAASALGIPHRLLPFADGSFLSSERRAVLSARIGGTTRLTLADGGLALATAFLGEGRDNHTVLPGHSGDTISGSKMGAARTATNEAVHAYLRHGYLQCFRTDVVRPLLRAGVADADSADRRLGASIQRHGGENPATMLQRWIMHDLINRRVLPEGDVYRDRAAVFLPFFDHALSDFFQDCPRGFLDGQRLYRMAAADHVIGSKCPALALVPLQGRGVLRPGGRTSGLSTGLPGRLYRRILKRTNVGAFEAATTACPMVSLWHRDAALRESVWKQLESSPVLPEIFQHDRLLDYLRRALGRDYTLTYHGVWGLLTVDGVGRALR